MATIHVSFGTAMGAGAPVYAPKPNAAQAITSSATSAATTIEAKQGDYASVTAVDGPVYAAIGASPTALASGAGMYCIPAGTTKDFGPLKDGEKVAVIDV